MVEAVSEILTVLGFNVRDMDAELEPKGPKYEDLRLTLDSRPGWEAIVEVKGYTKGTKKKDARQIRSHRDRYIKDNGREPDLTLWLANPLRVIDDPSSRRAPDGDIGEAAELVGAVYVLTSDLYRQWALVTRGEAEAGDVAQSLINSEPGFWVPPESD